MPSQFLQRKNRFARRLDCGLYEFAGCDRTDDQLSIPGAYPRGSEEAVGQQPAVVTAEGGIHGREAALLAATVIPALAISTPPMASNVSIYFIRLARFAGYAGLLAIVILSLVPG